MGVACQKNPTFRRTTVAVTSFWIALACVVSLTGCAADRPVAAPKDNAAYLLEQEKRMGAEQARKIERQMGLLNDENLTAYLNAMGQRLVEQLPQHPYPYTFRILDVAEPNAFAFPGGYVYVTRGLLALVNSEDELAGVVAHEIAHVAARHRLQQIARHDPFTGITSLAATATGQAGSLVVRLANDVGELATGYMLASYNRDQEREADRAGQKLMAQAGWDPAALPGILTTLERGQKLRRDNQRRAGFQDTHPIGADRIGDAGSYAGTLERVSRTPLSASRDAFLARLDGVVVGGHAAHGLIDGRSFRHPDQNFSVQFPDKWSVTHFTQQVVALGPEGRALIVLKAVSEGSDAIEGARLLQQASGAPILASTRRLTVGNLPAARAQMQGETKDGKLWLELAWLVHDGRIYQLAGMGPMKQREPLHALFDTMVHTFRPLSQSERANMREQRLRLVHAQGEPLDELIARSHSSWSKEEVAVANGLNGTETSPEGQVVKVAVPELYASPTVRRQPALQL
jgi:predicted Zn-dependent protease